MPIYSQCNHFTSVEKLIFLIRHFLLGMHHSDRGSGGAQFRVICFGSSSFVDPQSSVHGLSYEAI